LLVDTISVVLLSIASVARGVPEPCKPVPLPVEPNDAITVTGAGVGIGVAAGMPAPLLVVAPVPPVVACTLLPLAVVGAGGTAAGVIVFDDCVVAVASHIVPL
jgi:hypothetical protein